MPAGEAFTQGQTLQIRRAIATAQEETGLRFSVFVGPVPGSHASQTDVRTYAQHLHAALGDDADLGVLVFVEPESRRLEIVTGESAHLRLDDRAAGLASLSMATSFAGGDLAGGIVNGLRMMAQAAARPKPRVMHRHEISR
ncbi:MAG: hypothetical protein QOJ62_738 [Actinomycetota bacterium]|nr:hypothetical protein [Actinomycetota bacterium]